VKCRLVIGDVFQFWGKFESLRGLIATETTEFDAFISDFSKFSEFSGSKN
jgi:hypothetical protein